MLTRSRAMLVAGPVILDIVIVTAVRLSGLATGATLLSWSVLAGALVLVLMACRLVPWLPGRPINSARITVYTAGLAVAAALWTAGALIR